MRKSKNRLGFTLIEVTIVLVIVAVLAAITVPSVFRYLESGRQTNRTNVARTLYLAAQEQLNELRITKGMKATLDDYYDSSRDLINMNLHEHDGVNTNVYDLLGFPKETVPEGEDDNARDYVHYISKPAGQAPAGLIKRLLDPTVLDKTILNDAILIEFNIETGVVLSVFYGDRFEEGVDFDYLGDEKSERNISGGRGMDASAGYQYARDRKQGYFGVDNTGHTDGGFHAPIINIYDSFDVPIPGSGNQNVLYAEILISKDQIGKTYTLSIPGSQLSYEGLSLDPAHLPSGLSEAMAEGPHLYSWDTDMEGYVRIIWILDYVSGDTANLNHYRPSGIMGISSMYNIGGLFDAARNIYVLLEGSDGSSAISGEAHPYFNSNSESHYARSGFSVMSARHLYNIRYAQDQIFHLEEDIDLEAHGITNFAPIPGFGGTLEGSGKTIANLTAQGGENAGLFAEITQNGLVQNLTLDNPAVDAGENAGAVCGVLEGSVTDVYVRYTLLNEYSITAHNSDGAAGGFAGSISGGSVLNSVFISPNAAVHINARGFAGGIIGSGDGTISNVLYLALAPKSGGGIQPIAGHFSGTFNGAFYLSGSPVWPDAMPSGRIDYNGEANNGYGEGLSTWALTDEAARMMPGWIVKSGLTAGIVVDLGNPIYPYPHLSAHLNKLAAHPNWPIADGGESLSELEYYEFYQNGSFASLPYPFTGTGLGSDVVKHDGYMLTVLDYEGKDCKLQLGDTEFTLSLDGGAAAIVNGVPAWPVTVESAADTTKAVIYIPNGVLEEASKGEPIDVVLSEKGIEVLRRTINPCFAPEEAGLIRSPRHINNISLALEAAYTQQLHVDFRIYLKELAVTNNTASPKTGSELSFTSSAVVAGEFAGSYNGGGKEIRNLRINAPSTDNIGLFAQNNGTIYAVTMINPNISGNNNVGAVAGSSSGTIGQISGTTAQPVKVLSDTTLRGFAGIIGAGSNVGGVVGLNTGTLQYSFIGISKGKDSGDDNEHAAPNYVRGVNNVGGVVGANSGTGTVQVCYADYTEVGRVNRTSTNVGGVVGHLNGGTVKNVFYNYGNLDPQEYAYIETVFGASANTGYLVGHISSGSLSYAYSDAYLMNGNYLLIGGKTASAALPSNVLYLKQSGYNTDSNVPATVAPAVSARTAAQLRADATLLNTNNANVWAQGTTYAYPKLAALDEPDWWPMPEVSTSKLAYYEFYLYPNPNNGGKYYGLWSPDGSDTLDYRETQRVIEDGYIVLASANAGQHFLQVEDINGNKISLGNDDKRKPDKLSRFDDVLGFVLELDKIEGYMRSSDNKYGAIYPIRLKMGKNNGGTDMFDGYINPLFAKALYTRNQVNRIGNLSAQMAHFEGKNGFQYIVRTPRHIGNIGFNNAADKTTLAGHYLQEIDVDFGGLNTANGYWRNNNAGRTKPDSPASSNRVNINVGKSAAQGVFTGSYSAKSQYKPDGEFDKTGGSYIKAVKNLSLTGEAGTGNIGVFSQIGAGGVVEDLILRNNIIRGGSGTANNIGGLAGTNAGTIQRVSAEYCAVSGNTNIGGFTGGNSGTIKNVSFLSVNGLNDVPVKASASSWVAGGITGHNTGTISHAFYLAPAPHTFDTVFPIAGGGTPAGAANNFYLLGSRYALHNGGWTEDGYNFYKNSGGGSGLITEYMTLDWLTSAYENTFDKQWRHIDEYPYPVLWEGVPIAGWHLTQPPGYSTHPLDLRKTVTDMGDGTFTVRLAIDASGTDPLGAITAKGTATVEISKEFKLVTMPAGSTANKLANGNTLLTIPAIALAGGRGTAEYIIEYIGDEGGIVQDAASAGFRGVFYDPVLGGYASGVLNFPATSVDIHIE